MIILPLYPHASKSSNHPSAQLTQGSAGPHQGNSKGGWCSLIYWPHQVTSSSQTGWDLRWESSSGWSALPSLRPDSWGDEALLAQLTATNNFI